MPRLRNPDCLGRIPRAVVALGLVAIHANIYLLTPILYWQAMLLLVVFGLSADVPSYCRSKLTLNGVTIMQAQALKADGIVVNSMCPGWVRREMGGANAPRSVEQG